MTELVGKTTVTEKGQITIPKDIRNVEGIKPNDELFVVYADGTIIITKPEKGKLAKLFREASGFVTHEEIRQLRQENEESLKRKIR
ncbi:MAG: AbrB/MazE/SpoVT family DNA-binding domain-containing protein [Candidatus Aenigmarchaeota archaeon]|nr:AbrB/MazE/SpoVT family DNA-binding domain-containing protein [Candidatus Aenigmarchaeota archaeon]